MNIGDERPRIVDGDQAAMLEEYRIDSAIEDARPRWLATQALQTSAPQQPHPILATLRPMFETAAVQAAQEFLNAGPATIDACNAALHRANERLQLVRGEHAPLDEELHREHEALSPVLEKIDNAIALITKHEKSFALRGHVPWYRRRVADQGYWEKTPDGPRRAAWKPGNQTTETATRSDEIWFMRGGADPIVALTIARSVMAAVKPPSVTKNSGQFVDEQINRVLVLMKHIECNLPTKQVTQLLVALGYEPKKVSETALNRRLSDLRSKGHKQPTSKGARGRTLGRRRTKGNR